LFFLFKDNGIRTFWYLLFLALTILLADNISSSLFKPLVERLRPTHDPSLMKLIHTVHGYTGGLYGFVSSHAANTFGAALFTSLLLRNRRLSFVFFAWAILTSYSRMYLGVHFPLDILGGMVVGLLSGAFCYLLMELLSPKIFNRSNLPASPYFPAKERSYFLWIATAVFVFVVIKSFF
jgi:undecaprenyl-diphosphatase